MAAAISAALALSVAACHKNDQAPAPVGQNLEQPGAPTASPGAMDRTAQPAESRTERTAENAERKMDEPGKALDDSAVTAKVKSALVAEPNLKSTTINVDTMGGVVTLKGTAESQEVRQRAEQIASTVQGVRSVRNELVVIRG